MSSFIWGKLKDANIGASGSLLKSDAGKLLAFGTSAPTGTNIYAPGSLCWDTDASDPNRILYNQGTKASPSFVSLMLTPWPTGLNTSSVGTFKGVTGTTTNSYGSRMYNGNSQFSSCFGVGSLTTHLTVNSVGGGFAGYTAYLDVAGVKTNANDIASAFAARVNLSGNQTLGDVCGSTLYLRNSAQSFNSANAFACHLDYMYMGDGSATKTVRGHFIDILETATTPNSARDWIVFGAQLTGGALGAFGGNITAFYCNFLSTDLETRLTQKAAWFRGYGKVCIDLSGWTVTREAVPTNQYGAAQIVLCDVSSRPVSIFTYAGNPTGTSTVGEHAPGSICIDTTNKRLYMNVGTSAASPTWSYLSGTWT